MNRFRLTPVAKVLCLIIVLAIIGGGVFAGFKSGFIKNDFDKKPITSSSPVSASSSTEKEDTSVTNDSSAINLSLDEWIG